ncbi:DUF1257 domain-containing protein [Frankia sp. CNm7]|uniref:DUF1257 domain-containing protein n=1 Tax=Frankia nepalensis TaxID=1836974 RepID=A0A937RIS8_9ACTN|nr:DUF1257 domain-containing protein [Frankia nepalensis]MBL7497507.1 DUF1257 domain-containing protein [Frankia nepalensis]MBL7510226.1 DUF1257 domain-containing protein [Frankia nepalensis]MBL7518658.1 DUF1257 domain-containing protein [Frankia nepalensis]MBL7630937.1 DUF1257 domain-containing protein [Frankia nepalensis]
MSHFTQLRTKITELEHLVAALADVGYATVETHDEARPLRGYQGDRRRQRAHVIVRRQHVGAASNDLGFERQEDGTFRAWISEYDVRELGAGWLGRVEARYAYHATRATLARQGFSVAREETDRDGTVRLVLTRQATGF